MIQPSPQSRHIGALGEVFRIPENDPRLDGAERRALDIVSEAEDQFILNQPTTISGVAAVLRYVAEHDEKMGDELCDSTSQFENDDGDVFSFQKALFLALADTLDRVATGRKIEPGRLKRCEADEDDEEEEVVAQEPPKPWTLEEQAESFRRVIDHCTARLTKIEAKIATAGAAS
jgi:hypothetical protein